MDTEKQRAYLQRAKEIKETISEADRDYYNEQLIRDYYNDIDQESLPYILAITDKCLSGSAKQLVHNALRDNAIWPDQVVQSDHPLEDYRQYALSKLFSE